MSMPADLTAFVSFGKIHRWSRDVVVTEKIDGSNGQICFDADGTLRVGSRTRWITPDSDNFGFASWCFKHKELLWSVLGVGRHFGEWWGSGIQRTYGMPPGVRKFSLFNTLKWSTETLPLEAQSGGLDVVPVLWRGNMDQINVPQIMEDLKQNGSFAAPFMNPEGIVVYHLHGNVAFKKTFEHDEAGKG